MALVGLATGLQEAIPPSRAEIRAREQRELDELRAQSSQQQRRRVYLNAKNSGLGDRETARRRKQIERGMIKAANGLVATVDPTKVVP